MLIIGWRTIPFTRDRGAFYCPQCAVERPYTQKRGICFLTLYFIPVIPIMKEGEWVECDACGSAFQLEVLKYKPGDEWDEVAVSVRRLLVMVMLEANAAGAANIQELRSFCREALGASVTDEQIQQDVLDIQQSSAQLETLAEQIRDRVDSAGKSLIVQGAVRIVVPHASATAHQQDVLRRLHEALTAVPSP